ncbi:MAG: hypothetical protein WC823_04560 [Parcubacteria group bacterium]|jgi:hypothetical protein
MEKLKKFWESLMGSRREIYRIHIAHTIRSIALSFIVIYVPVYLFNLGYSLKSIIFFYAILHGFGLLFTVFVISPLMQRVGLVRIFRFYYPLEILFYTSLYFMQAGHIPFGIVAMFGGMATFTYWVPLNILLVKHADFDKMGTDLATFFALPKIFQVLNPLISVVMVYFVGFWPIFVIVAMGLVLSYIPLHGIKTHESQLSLHWKETFVKIRKRKKLFFLEVLDNVIEESHWYWSIYVYLMIGTLAVPGIVGSLSALGGVLFMIFVGKKANKKPEKLIVIAALLMVAISVGRIFSQGQILAYVLTLAGSFAMTFLLVPYFGYIYRAIKDRNEEEFIVLREVPTVIGRLIVFGCILLTLNHPQYFFVLPAIVAVIMIGMFIIAEQRRK